MTQHFELILIATVVAVACALPGVFLVLRRMALMSDAISHALLPGIAVAFLWTQDMAHPLLFVAAVVMGLVTVTLTELLGKTKLVHADAAIGLVFPFLFSVGVLLVARYASKVHLDTDAVLLGELAFAPFHRLEIAGIDLGPKALVTMGGILLLNLILIGLFYKELKLSTFDPGLAAAMGFAPVALHYGLMVLVSVTAVGAFDAVGSILVVALMVVPGSTAYLLTQRLGPMLALSAFLAASSAALGYSLAVWLDASIAGAIAAMNGIFFVGAFLFAPRRGIIAMLRLRQRQRLEFGTQMLLVHLLHHQGGPRGPIECRRDHLLDHINWKPPFAHRVVESALGSQLVTDHGGLLRLTQPGLERARRVMEQ